MIKGRMTETAASGEIKREMSVVQKADTGRSFLSPIIFLLFLPLSISASKFICVNSYNLFHPTDFILFLLLFFCYCLFGLARLHSSETSVMPARLPDFTSQKAFFLNILNKPTYSEM